MQYDKFGDPIETESAGLRRSQTRLLAVFVGIQVVLILLNVAILFVSFLNLYLCFITAPIFLFLFIALVKMVHSQKENGVAMPVWIRAAMIVLPVLYVITAILAVFGNQA